MSVQSVFVMSFATAEPATEATAEPATEATAEPATEATAEPAAEATAEPATKPATNPAAEATAAEATTEPATNPAAEPTNPAAEATKPAEESKSTKPKCTNKNCPVHNANSSENQTLVDVLMNLVLTNKCPNPDCKLCKDVPLKPIGSGDSELAVGIPALTVKIAVKNLPDAVTALLYSKLSSVEEICAVEEYKKDLVNFAAIKTALQFTSENKQTTKVRFNRNGIVMHKNVNVPYFLAPFLPKVVERLLVDYFGADESWRTLIEFVDDADGSGWNFNF